MNYESSCNELKEKILIGFERRLHSLIINENSRNFGY